MTTLGMFIVVLLAVVPFSFVIQAFLLSIFAPGLNLLLKLLVIFMTVLLQILLICIAIPELGEPSTNQTFSVMMISLLWLAVIGLPWLTISKKSAANQT